MISTGPTKQMRPSAVSRTPTPFFTERNTSPAGTFCPAGVPTAEFETLKNVFEEVAQSQAFIDSMEQAGIPYLYMGAEEFQQYARDASAALADVVAFMNQ